MCCKPGSLGKSHRIHLLVRLNLVAPLGQIGHSSDEIQVDAAARAHAPPTGQRCTACPLAADLLISLWCQQPCSVSIPKVPSKCFKGLQVMQLLPNIPQTHGKSSGCQRDRARERARESSRELSRAGLLMMDCSRPGTFASGRLAGVAVCGPVRALALWAAEGIRRGGS